MYRWMNFIEAGVGAAMGMAVIGRALWCAADRRAGLVAGAALVLFGLSDVVEAGTGAWWRPWWLLAWKLTCFGGDAVVHVAVDAPATPRE